MWDIKLLHAIGIGLWPVNRYSSYHSFELQCVSYGLVNNCSCGGEAAQTGGSTRSVY